MTKLPWTCENLGVAPPNCTEDFRLHWKPIQTAPHNGREIIVGVDIADTWIVRSAWWRNGDETPDFDETDRGWWSYKNSVTQEMLEGIYEPTHWLCVVPGH